MDTVHTSDISAATSCLETHQTLLGTVITIFYYHRRYYSSDAHYRGGVDGVNVVVHVDRCIYCTIAFYRNYILLTRLRITCECTKYTTAKNITDTYAIIPQQV